MHLCVVSIAAAAPIVLTMWEAKFGIRQSTSSKIYCIDVLYTKVESKPSSNPGHKRAFVCGIALVVGAIFFNYVPPSCSERRGNQKKPASGGGIF